jgi:signal transduction histidine kinase
VTVDLLALGGWVAAIAAAAAALVTRRVLAQRLEDVARASHELRGGIGAARLGLALATPASELSPTRVRAVELELDRAALALDDLDGRPSTGAFGSVDVEDLLTDCVEAARAVAAVTCVELRMSWAGRRAIVVGDRVRLGQAIANLIVNAIEHGGGVVEVRGAHDEAAVTIEVLDDGPGLPKPVAELIRRRRRRGGRGLGLGIAADIVRCHGGRLSAAPSVSGARLMIELPAQRGSQGRLRAS